MFDSRFEKTKRRIIEILLGFFVVGTVFFPFSAAQAVLPVEDVPLLGFFTGKEVEGRLAQNVSAALLGVAVSALSYFTRRLAYDTAVWVAHGGKGKGELAFKDGFGSYMEKIGQDTAAEAIGALGEPLGLNLCQIPDLRIHAALLIGFRQLYQGPPQPRCSWQDVRKVIGVDGGKAWKERYGTEKGLSETFSTSLSVQNSDFGVALDSMAQIDRITNREQEGARLGRLETQGFKPVTDLISGNILTPGQLVLEESTALTRKHQGSESTKQAAGIYASGFTQIIPQTISVFLNTLTGELLQRLLESLLQDGGGSSSDLALNPYADTSFQQDIEDARKAFAELLVRKPTQLTNYQGQLIAEFAACPDSYGLNNCVIDTGLQEALARAQTGVPMTIQEAMDEGFLHETWPLISPRHESHADVPGCQVGRYCYSNIQKLRKARILPLGFEIAALRSDPDKPWTLGDVIRGFDQCKRSDPTNPHYVEPDPTKPFCHLINPNWIIFIPDARCEASVIGPKLASEEASLRREECVDISTCIARDANGECVPNGYGYCTKEENTWLIPGRACEAWAKTCTTFTNTGSGQVASYLARTVDYGECTIDNKGCLGYSTERVGDNWRASVQALSLYKSVGRNQTLFFNEKIQSVSGACQAGNDGCTAFYGALRELGSGRYLKNTENKYLEDTRAPIHLKKAPDYMGCYDTNPVILGNQWPTTLQQIQNVVSQDERCDAFASVCIPSEVGCESFIPLKGRTGAPDTAPKVPGIIGNDQVCQAECVGYDVFKQEATAFDPEAFPLYFIPTDGQSCAPEYAGCSEFTNLEELARGGEALEYYTKIKYCEQPTEDRNNLKVYYSWEGSVEDGFVLQVHRLRPMNAADQVYIDALVRVNLGDFPADGAQVFGIGSPSYADDNRTALIHAANTCNARTYNLRINEPLNLDVADPDCRALYDEEGSVYYRLLSELVTVSDQCRTLRKTEKNLVLDNVLTPLTLVSLQTGGRNICLERGGQWEDLPNDAVNGSVCLRCAGGGRFINGECIYNAIAGPEESATCPAAANLCRAYSGNTANNVEQVFLHQFEPGGEGAAALRAARADWFGGGLSIAAEAIQVGSHSLQVDAGGGVHSIWYKISTSTLKTDEWYEVSFWARGGSAQLQIGGSFRSTDPITGQDRVVSLGNVWREYRFGPMQYTGQNDIPGQLTFSVRSTNGQPVTYFLDEVRLTRLQDYTYIIKDSWKIPNGGFDVPLSCDLNRNDGLPGAALGCRAYKEENSQVTRYATGFEQLCRPKAVGCQPVWDTFNTVTGDQPERAHVYNAWCERQGPATCELGLNGQPAGSCEVERGQSGCYIKEIVVPAIMTFQAVQNAGIIRTSTVYIPADTPTSSPIFLANRPEFRCPAGQIGCQLVGQEVQTLPSPGQPSSYTHTDVMVKNDPAVYGEVLCRDDLVGCSEFRHNNQISYFKDPLVTGNSICEYRGNTGLGQPFGWFLRDSSLGQCNTNTSILCQEDANCPAAGAVQGRCLNIGRVACYEDHIQRGGMYDIWSSASANYEGFVGSCPAQYNQCTELVDTADTSNVHPEGKPYYVIFDRAIEDRLDDCTSVSLRDGCVLFNKTDEPNKYYNSSATYAASALGVAPYGEGGQGVAPYGPVKAVETQTDINRDGRPDSASIDSNILLKVNRDRQCSEWLACKTSMRVPVNGVETQKVCYQYQACEALGDGDSSCSDWVDDLEDVGRATGRLTYEQYMQRPVSWFDAEFSGYALFNRFQITNLVYVGFDVADDDLKRDIQDVLNKTYIVRELRQGLIEEGNGNEDVDCQVVDRGEPTDWRACGFDGGGRCYAERCLYPVEKDAFITTAVLPPTAESIRKTLGELEPNSCKGVPEQDSPYPRDIVVPGVGGRQLARADIQGVRVTPGTTQAPYRSVNVCQTSGECSCNYKKVIYENGQADYWNVAGKSNATGLIPQKICQGGTFEGYPCASEDDCKDDDGSNPGTCVPQQKIEDHIGLEGYCLEYDLSRPIGFGRIPFACLTWLPIQASASRGDIYNAFYTAGYQPQGFAAGGDSDYGQAYCVNATAFPLHNQGDNDRIRSMMITGENRNRENPETVFPPRAGIDDYRTCLVDCGGGQFDGDNCTASNFHEQFCQGDAVHGSNGILQFLESWSKKHIDPSALLLRAEIPVGDTGNDGAYTAAHNNVLDDDHADVEDGCGNRAPDGSPACTLYSFAPSGHGWFDYGTAMHPPRVWDEETGNDIRNQCEIFVCEDENNNEVACPLPDGGGAFQLPEGWDFVNVERDPICANAFRSFVYQSDQSGFWLATHPYSPETPLLRGAAGQQDPDIYLDGNLLEKNINGREATLLEKEINKVYFLVTGFPYGAEGYNPGIMNTALFIDFPSVRTNGVDVRAQTVPVTWEIGDARGFFFPEVDGDVPAGDVYTYYQAPPPANSYGDYQSLDPESYLSTLFNEPRNAIAKRYVLLFFKESTEEFSDDLEEELTVDEGRFGFDPFTSGCNANTANWFAIGMDFNADGEFLGYISRWCNGTHEAQGSGVSGIQFAVVATRNNQCVDIRQVYDEENKLPLFDITNKAWTNRVWREAAATHPVGGYRAGDFALHNQERIPFGSLPVREGDIQAQSESKLLHFFIRPDLHGIPYACHAGGTQNCDNLGRVHYDERLLQVLRGKTKDNAVSALHQLFAMTFGRVAITSIDGEQPRTIEPDAADSDLSGDIGIDVPNAINGEPLLPPQIYSLNPSRCDGPSAKCIAGESNNMTVGTQNGTMTDYDLDGLPDEDRDNGGDGVPDSIIAPGGVYFARLRFFAFADDNRMPIRRVMVRWTEDNITNGDGIRGKWGLYQNHKPVCEETDMGGETTIGQCFFGQNVYTGVTCSNDRECPVSAPAPNDTAWTCRQGNNLAGVANGIFQTKRFGNLPRACSTLPFEFTNEYTCSQSDIAAAERALGRGEPFPEHIRRVADVQPEQERQRLLELGLEPQDLVCVFKPAVQVMDNWGWCNGTCDNPNIAGQQRYPFGGCYNDESGRGAVKQCDSHRNFPSWTEYKGQIIVIPSQ